MSSGRRDRVMIACVTFETVKITNAIEYYKTTRNHLIHYVKDPASENGKIYSDFYERVNQIIRDNSIDDTEIIEHNKNVNNFPVMLQTVLGILESEYKAADNSDIFINISAGTAEYTSAATLAAMMYPKSIPFSISSKKFTTENFVREIYYKNGVPIGLTSETYPPKAIPKISIPVPDEKLVRGLRILDGLNAEKGSTKGPRVISELKKQGIWFREENTEINKTARAKNDSVYYYRDFITKWLENNWVYRDKYTKKYLLTEEGKRIVDTFFV
jgi:hypothetical protein